jgi:hypothetical protein
MRRSFRALAAGALGVLAGALLISGRPPRSSGRGGAKFVPSPQAAAAGFETSDMSAGVVGKVLAVFAGVVVVSVALLFGMISFFHRGQEQHPALTAEQSATIVPPAPNLQPDPYRDLRELRAREKARLENYAWADDAHDAARIPIERAMRLVTGRSLEPSP